MAGVTECGVTVAHWKAYLAYDKYMFIRVSNPIRVLGCVKNRV